MVSYREVPKCCNIYNLFFVWTCGQTRFAQIIKYFFLSNTENLWTNLSYSINLLLELIFFKINKNNKITGSNKPVFHCSFSSQFVTSLDFLEQCKLYEVCHCLAAGAPVSQKA